VSLTVQGALFQAEAKLRLAVIEFDLAEAQQPGELGSSANALRTAVMLAADAVQWVRYDYNREHGL